MPKSMPQSKQASLCITINMKHFTYLQHQSTYLKHLSQITKIRELIIPYQRKQTSSEQNKNEKQELNAVLEKQNTRRTIRMKTRVFFAIKTECVFSKTNIARIQPFITANKTKENKKKQKLRRSKNNTQHMKQ